MVGAPRGNLVRGAFAGPCVELDRIELASHAFRIVAQRVQIDVFGVGTLETALRVVTHPIVRSEWTDPGRDYHPKSGLLGSSLPGTQIARGSLSL